MSYTNLEIFNISLDLFLKTHPTSLKLPKFELYELGSQLRRSADSIVSNIVEGYGRRRYKQEYIRFLVFAHSSNDETIIHLRKILFLYPDLKEYFEPLYAEYDNLGGKINNYKNMSRITGTINNIFGSESWTPNPVSRTAHPIILE